jgi:hypothetical protein
MHERNYGKKLTDPSMSAKKEIEDLLSSLRREKMKMRKCSGTGKGEYFSLKCLCILAMHIFYREIKQLHSTRC